MNLGCINLLMIKQTDPTRNLTIYYLVGATAAGVCLPCLPCLLGLLHKRSKRHHIMPLSIITFAVTLTMLVFMWIAHFHRESLLAFIDEHFFKFFSMDDVTIPLNTSSRIATFCMYFTIIAAKNVEALLIFLQGL